MGSGERPHEGPLLVASLMPACAARYALLLRSSSLVFTLSACGLPPRCSSSLLLLAVPPRRSSSPLLARGGDAAGPGGAERERAGRGGRASPLCGGVQRPRQRHPQTLPRLPRQRSARADGGRQHGAYLRCGSPGAGCDQSTPGVRATAAGRARGAHLASRGGAALLPRLHRHARR